MKWRKIKTYCHKLDGVYKMRWLILVGIIFAGIIYFIVSPQVDKEYQKYGYTGLSDNIKYDTWTGEIIPKQEISTYNNDDKFIINSKGNKIYFSQMKEQINKFSEIQGSYASFSKDKVKSIDDICNILLRDYLNLNYEIINWGESTDRYVIQIRGEYEKSYYSEISNPSELEGLVKEVVKEKYKI